MTTSSAVCGKMTRTCLVQDDLHHRVHNSRVMRNLLDEEYEKACLKDDLGKRSNVKCILPLNHISACVAARFKGQSWIGV